MRLYIDDDSVDPSLLRLLRRDRHDVQVPADAGLAGSSDQIHLAHAIRSRRAILTRNYIDFEGLHDLVVAANGQHEGILVVRYDSNPRNHSRTAVESWASRFLFQQEVGESRKEGRQAARCEADPPHSRQMARHRNATWLSYL